jgi:hypothetical protein
MAISRTHTAKSIWREAVRDLIGYEGEKQVIDIERFNVINRAQDQVASMFYPLIKNQYVTEQLVIADTASAYSTAAGTFTLLTRVLAIAMNADFGPLDIGKMVVFRVGAAVYVGYIDSVTNTTTVVLQNGNSLPTADSTVDYAIKIASVPSSDIIDISSLRIKSGSGDPDVVIQSTATRSIYAVSLDEYMTFRAAAAQNATKIVFHIADLKIYLKTGLASYGTITLYYPRLPAILATDTDAIDIPDGVPTTLLISLVKKTVADRLNVTGAFNPADMQSLVYDFWKAHDTSVTLQEIKDKMQALT